MALILIKQFLMFVCAVLFKLSNIILHCNLLSPVHFTSVELLTMKSVSNQSLLRLFFSLTVACCVKWRKYCTFVEFVRAFVSNGNLASMFLKYNQHHFVIMF